MNIPDAELQEISNGLDGLLKTARDGRGILDVDTLTTILLDPHELTRAQHLQCLAASLAIACLRLINVEAQT